MWLPIDRAGTGACPYDVVLGFGLSELGMFQEMFSPFFKKHGIYGKSRDKDAKKAGDHDMNHESKLIPYGILDVLNW